MVTIRPEPGGHDAKGAARRGDRRRLSFLHHSAGSIPTSRLSCSAARYAARPRMPAYVGNDSGMQASSSTRIRAAMAMDAAWTISTARSPTMWQPRIMHVARSTISLQNPVVRPSMIVRAVVSKRTTVTATSCDSRAFASVSPTRAYSGSVRLPMGLPRPEASSWGRGRRWWPRRSRRVQPAGPASSGR